MPRPLLLGFILFSAVASLLGGIDQASKPGVSQASAARCPLIYAPVICDHGKVYPNPCEAERHHARNCVPYGL